MRTPALLPDDFESFTKTGAGCEPGGVNPQKLSSRLFVSAMNVSVPVQYAFIISGCIVGG